MDNYEVPARVFTRTIREDSEGELWLDLPEELNWLDGDIIDWDVQIDSDGVTQVIATNITKKERDKCGNL